MDVQYPDIRKNRAIVFFSFFLLKQFAVQKVRAKESSTRYCEPPLNWFRCYYRSTPKPKALFIIPDDDYILSFR